MMFYKSLLLVEFGQPTARSLNEVELYNILLIVQLLEYATVRPLTNEFLKNLAICSVIFRWTLAVIWCSFFPCVYLKKIL